MGQLVQPCVRCAQYLRQALAAAGVSFCNSLSGQIGELCLLLFLLMQGVQITCFLQFHFGIRNPQGAILGIQVPVC